MPTSSEITPAETIPVNNQATIQEDLASATQQVAAKSIIQEKDVLSSLISADVDYVKRISEELQRYNNKVNDRLADAKRRLDELTKEGDEFTDKDYRELRKAVIKLKVHLPTTNKLSEGKDQHRDQQSMGVLEAMPGPKIPTKVIEKFPQLHGSDVLRNSRDFKDFEACYKNLSPEMKLCLLCFSAFPENVIIKKRLMVYWWIAEGFVPPIGTKKGNEEEKTPEDFANEYFYELLKRGFIEPANKKRSLSVGACRMHPLIRSALVMIAEKAKFFDFDTKGEPIENFAGSLRACLVGNGLLDYNDLRNGIIRVEDLEKLHLVFNVSERILEFRTEWFLSMKNVNILYLGSWKVSARDHIELEETEFLDGLRIMKYLKFFSLQGVSRITELPESVTKLLNLRILDIRACHNLETIPKGIGLLKNLTHLDMSECYLLEHMPKSLAMLLELQVLKGFVVQKQGKNSCTLEDLVKLRKLEKLSIYTGLQQFPTENDVRVLQNFNALRKLTIAWGGGALHASEDQESSGASQAEARTKIEKKQASSLKRLLTKSLKKDIPATQRPKTQPKMQHTEATSSSPSPDKQDQVEDKKEANTTAKELKAPAKTKTSEASSSKSASEEQKEGEHKMEDNAAAEQAKALADVQKTEASASSRPSRYKQEQVKDKNKAERAAEEAKAPPLKTRTTEASSSKSVIEEQKEGGEKMKDHTTAEQVTALSDIQKAEASSSRRLHDKQEQVEQGKANTAAEAAKAPPAKEQTIEEQKQGPGKTKQNKIAGQSKAHAEKQKPGAPWKRSNAFNQNPWKLEKLDLKCFPTTTTPAWLTSSYLWGIKKLYIRGGKFSDLGQFQEFLGSHNGDDPQKKWDVKILRLKYLSELEMDWRELQELFPELIYLEKVGCPKLSFFPCDATGVWINKEKLKEKAETSNGKVAIFSPSYSY